MVTTWPPNFPVVGTGANMYAEWVKEMTNGQALSKGVVNYLVDPNVRISQIIQKSGHHEMLDRIICGPKPPNPSELLLSPRLRSLVQELKEEYDFIIIDCSPSLGLITVNALTAADSVIIPVQCEYFALEGLGKLLNTIKIIQSRLNINLQIEGILLTMYDVRLRLSNQVVDEVNTHFKNLVFETIIPRNIKLSESPSFGIPAIVHDAESKGAISYLNLAKEILLENDMVV